MGNAFKWILIVLGVIEIVLAFKMDVITKRKYENVKVRDIEGLIKWEKVSNIFMGIAIIFFAVLDIMGGYEKYSTPIITVIFVLMIFSYLGRKKFI